MTREGVQSLAAAILSAVAAFVSLIAAEFLSARTPEAQILAFLVGTVGYYALFRLVLWIGSLIRYRKVLGTWRYVSLRYDNPEARSFARMKFYIAGGGGLDYAVTIYASHDDLIAAETAPAASTGDAHSLTCRFEERLSRIDIIYEASFRAEEMAVNSRFGLIRVKLVEGDMLESQWVSSTGGVLNKGIWFAARPNKFDELLKHLEQRAQRTLQQEFGVHVPKQLAQS